MTDVNRKLDDEAFTAQQSNALSKRDLEMVLTTLRGKYGVTIYESAGFWSIAVKFEGQSGLFSIETARGNKLKGWRHLIGAIEFVQNSCPHAQYVVINVGDWQFCRVKDPEARVIARIFECGSTKLKSTC
jgi:hypothetical protein